VRPRWAAHRGGALCWPENSLRAFREALGLGAPLLELDVHLTRDGGVVVIHDRTLERTTDGTGVVADVTTDELRRLRLRDRDGALTTEPVPMLDDVLALVAGSPAELLLEVKGPAVPAFYERRAGRVHPIPGPRYEDLEVRTVEALDRHDMRRRTTMLAFNPDVIGAVHEVAPGMRTTFLVGAGHLTAPSASMDEMLDIALSLGVAEVGVEHTLASANVVGAAHRRGLGVGVWTVNDAALMRRYRELGVDIVTTDRPDLAAEVFRS
jgi:glycerophosphoryl diester phosphodiesterase